MSAPRRFARLFPFVARQLLRRPARLLLTGLGIAVAAALLVGVASIDRGVRRATETTAGETRLVVYRANRFCPFTSRLPQFYRNRIASIEGVAAVTPVRIVVTNCRASLDVVTFRAVPPEDLERLFRGEIRLREGSLEEWRRRGDAALVGAPLAARRGIRVGDRFSAAGITVTVAGILESEEAQERNALFVPLGFLQEAVERGGTGGVVTQFTVDVADPSRLGEVAAAIDREFLHDLAPTSTKPETAFAASAARDIVQLAGFARWLAFGALVLLFGLVANAIALALAERSREIAILETLGFRPSMVTAMVVAEGALLGLAGGAVGALAAWALLSRARLAVATEGIQIEFSTEISVALVALAASAATGALASLVPSILAARRPIAASLREG
jgi:putative ABC transport system permease protein